MPTFGDMKTAIADDFDDTTGEYTAAIARAIQSAIRYCEIGRYYFTQDRGSRRYPVLVNDTDRNVWTEDAYDMIKARAKYILAKDTLRDLEAAGEAKADYEDQHERLKTETSYRYDSGFVTPTTF